MFLNFRFHSALQMSETATSSVSPSVLARDFLTLQEERVRQYGVLEKAHKDYMHTAPNYDIDGLQTTVSNVTKAFQDISLKIIAMKSDFDAKFNDKDMANYINKIQLLEQKKLKFTVDHQLALQQVFDHRDDALMEKNAQALKNELDKIVEEINENLEEVRYHIHDLQDR